MLALRHETAVRGDALAATQRSNAPLAPQLLDCDPDLLFG
jgi:hypothetical protein